MECFCPTYFFYFWLFHYFIFGFNLFVFIYHVILVYFSSLRVGCGFTLWLLYHFTSNNKALYFILLSCLIDTDYKRQVH